MDNADWKNVSVDIIPNRISLVTLKTGLALLNALKKRQLEPGKTTEVPRSKFNNFYHVELVLLAYSSCTRA